MRITSRRLVAGVFLFVIAGCVDLSSPDEPAGDSDETPATSSEGLAISIDAPSPSYAAGESAWVDVTYTNVSTQPIRVLSWTVPSDDLWEDLFAVEVDGVRAPYIGRVYKRPAPGSDDFVTLAPGESIRGRVDLARLYDLARTGDYRVQVDTGFTALTALPASALPEHDAVRSNAIRVHAEGRTAALRDDDVVDKYYGISFSQCASWQKQLVRDGMDWAEEWSDEAFAHMSAGWRGSDRRYTRWFGSYSSSRWRTVTTTFDKIQQRINNNRIRFHCDCDEDYYAYVYPNQPYNIYMCNVYWDASLDDKGGTIIHELSHFYAVAGTDDIVYGVSGSERLAATRPNDAVRNADNIAYFCQLP